MAERPKIKEEQMNEADRDMYRTCSKNKEYSQTKQPFCGSFSIRKRFFSSHLRTLIATRPLTNPMGMRLKQGGGI